MYTHRFRCPRCGQRTKVANEMCNNCKKDVKAHKEYYRPNDIVGQQDFDSFGRPICKVCGRPFDNLPFHLLQVHNLTTKQYREKYDIEQGKALLSTKVRKKIGTTAPKHPPNMFVKGDNSKQKGKPKRLTQAQRQRKAEIMREVVRKRWHSSDT